MQVKILQNILGANEVIARRNQDRLDRYGILAVNVMSSPGSGKTSLILQTIKHFKRKLGIAVIEGDTASSIDADKVQKKGVQVVQINTGFGGCHLEAHMIENALNNLSLENISLLLIENVGNLICPAEFSLGEHKQIMLLSVPEGDDKPHKYPLIFTKADVVLVNKIDLLPYLTFNMTAFNQTVNGLNSRVKILPVSCQTGAGLKAWFSWLEDELAKRKSPGAQRKR